MRTLTLLLLLFISCIGFGQQNASPQLEAIIAGIKENIAQPQHQPVFPKPNVANILKPVQQDLTAFRQGLPALVPPLELQRPLPPGNAPFQRPTNGSTCPDTSSRRLLGVQNAMVYLTHATTTADGGILASLTFFDTVTYNLNPYWTSYGMLVKLDADGNMLWNRKLIPPSNSQISALNLLKVFELSNQDIICSGTFDTSGSRRADLIVFRLTSTGALVWQQRMRSRISLFNSPEGAFTYDIQQAISGLNDEVVLCGTSYSNISSGRIQTVCKVDNTGQLVWDINFGNHGADGSYRWGAEGISVFINNGELLLAGITHGSNNPSTPPAVNFARINYTTGNIIAQRFYRIDYPDQLEQFEKSFTFWNNQCVRLANGHYVFHGKLFDSYMNNTGMKAHFGVLEVDQSLNFVAAYTISADITTNYTVNQLHFEGNGNGVVLLNEYLSQDSCNLFVGTFTNSQLQKQRKIFIPGAILPNIGHFLFLQGNAYGLLQTFYATNPGLSHFEYIKMHNSDTASPCLGLDTSFLHFYPLNMIEDPAYFFFEEDPPNQLVDTAINIQLATTTINNGPGPCVQVSYCDQVKIHGSNAVCGNTGPVLFTAFKNAACGANITWQIDSAGIDSLRIVNDTTVNVWFRNINWQGLLIASLPAGSCNTAPADSILVNVVRQQTPIHLGEDSILCSNNTILLQANANYSSYTWQDGSTNATFLVTQPGTYSLNVNDGCGNQSADTIVIRPASFNFSIGNDTVRCNNDTIRLTATPGFSNYQWNPAYQLSTVNATTADVYPLTDTLYYCSAEKWPGCQVSDTVHLAVRRSPVIFLGADTSLCKGKSLLLDAGPGFIRYQWSNGASSRQQLADSAGIYRVLATASNGCTSSDTLHLTAIIPLPVFSLGNDTTLCSGATLAYSFNLAGASYRWNDGSLSGQYEVKQPGNYFLTVTQATCTASDTVIIAYLPTPVVKLGSDTVLCGQNQLVLQTAYPAATHSWQDGATGNTYSVTKAGTYTVAVNLNGCYGRDTLQVKYNERPYFELGEDTSICSGQSIVLRPLVTGEGTYLWQQSVYSDQLEINSPGTYTLEASNQCGKFVDSISVSENVCQLVLPNAFSPDGNSMNDVFKVKYYFATRRFLLSVYNRFGEKVFSTNDMSTGWNGMYKGARAAAGNYSWIIDIETTKGFRQVKTGNILLIR